LQYFLNKPGPTETAGTCSLRRRPRPLFSSTLLPVSRPPQPEPQSLNEADLLPQIPARRQPIVPQPGTETLGRRCPSGGQPETEDIPLRRMGQGAAGGSDNDSDEEAGLVVRPNSLTSAFNRARNRANGLFVRGRQPPNRGAVEEVSLNGPIASSNEGTIV
jgi:hypothetical protein